MYDFIKVDRAGMQAFPGHCTAPDEHILGMFVRGLSRMGGFCAATYHTPKSQLLSVKPKAVAPTIMACSGFRPFNT